MKRIIPLLFLFLAMLGASTLVPVKLEAGNAYMLDASDKRNNVSQ